MRWNSRTVISSIPSLCQIDKPKKLHGWYVSTGLFTVYYGPYQCGCTRHGWSEVHHVGGYDFIFLEPYIHFQFSTTWTLAQEKNGRVLWNAYLCVTVCLFLVTGADYPHPPRDDVEYLSPRRAPRSKYRYLDSDGALFKIPVWPMPSETKVWRTWRYLNAFESFVSSSAC